MDPDGMEWDSRKKFWMDGTGLRDENKEMGRDFNLVAREVYFQNFHHVKIDDKNTL